ncbi:hypothetical protein E2P81_ATG09872 [Venturia nashicola]|uniref:Uncharacterized protein n=1 Tax=Venturia nashicola TaxID=86259 RepID=A0A4Z1NGN6_9PEZI|nr:hypothetical protein E6O75_ATG10089 [Venturia nashicola]TLD15024.1 hypothetical protein E2P81_ATG09872 [Venturia nashicola]
MCIFKHIQYEDCDCSKRIRISTCSAAFQENTKYGRVPSCTDAGDWDLATFTLPSSCPLCQIDRFHEQVYDQLDEKRRHAALAKNNATEQLFEYLGDDKPAFTSENDKCIGEDGKTVARIFINDIEVQSGRVDEETAKRVVAQAEGLLDQWNYAKNQWTVAREAANPHWYPPTKLDHVCGIKKAYTHWFRKCVNADEIDAETDQVFTQWNEDHSRLEGYRKARLDMGDKEGSIRGHLPFMEQPQRTTKAFPSRPSPLRRELKAEDIGDSEDEGEMVDLVDSDDDDEGVWRDIDEMIAKFGHLV